MRKTKFEQQREFEMMNNPNKEERERFLFEYRKNNFMSFDSTFVDSIHPRNKKLLLDFMEYLAYSPMTKRTCQNMKMNLALFFKWNMTYNNNMSFRGITKDQGESFFLFLKEAGYSYVRVKCVKSDICSLADYAQFVLGRNEYHKDGTGNQWFSYKHNWREVDIQQEEPGFRKSNVHSFSMDKLEALHFYLKSQRDYMGLIILEFCDLGKDILTLQVDSEIFVKNQTLTSAQKYLEWKEQVGATDVTNVLISIQPNGSYAPMSLLELRSYTKMFSVFLGKDFIIC